MLYEVKPKNVGRDAIKKITIHLNSTFHHLPSSPLLEPHTSSSVIPTRFLELLFFLDIEQLPSRILLDFLDVSKSCSFQGGFHFFQRGKFKFWGIWLLLDEANVVFGQKLLSKPCSRLESLWRGCLTTLCTLFFHPL